MENNEVMRALSRSVTGVLIVVLLGLGIAGSAAAQADSPSCDPASAAHITAVLTPDGHATYTVENALPLCDPVPIGLAVYLKDANGLVFPQSLVDSSTDTITSGSKNLTVTLPQSGTSPQCFTQLDAFTGQPLPQITETEQYGDRLLAFLFGEVPNCTAAVEAESTTTSTTTTTTIKGGNDTTPPSDVEAVAVTRSSGTAPQAQATPLARTGAKVDLEPLVTASGWLLAIGGTLIALAHHRPRRNAS